MPGTDEASSNVIEQTRPAQEVAPEPSLEETFLALVDLWQNKTGHYSSISQKLEHPAYREIVQLGAPVIPLILRRMRVRPGFLFMALEAITGESPSRDGTSPGFKGANEAWFRWGEEHGY